MRITARLSAWLLAASLVAPFCVASEAIGSAGHESPAPESPRQRTRIDDGWRFAFGHATDPAKDFCHGTRPFFFSKAGYGDGPADPTFDDRAWRKLDLPHDWAVELPFDPRGTTSHGSKAIGRAFPENSVGLPPALKVLCSSLCDVPLHR